MNLGIETEVLEFKKSTSELKEACVSISAILNKHGVGTLYFGVKNNGDVVGQAVSENTLRDVSHRIAEAIKPQIYPTVTKEFFEDKHVIKVEFHGEESPYSSSGRYYLRVADEDREVSSAQLKKMFSEVRPAVTWERFDSGMSDKTIDKQTLKRFVENATAAGRLQAGTKPGLSLLRQLGLLEEHELNRAGAYLFSKEAQIPLKMAVFATDEKLTFLDITTEEDNIINLLEVSEKYILKNIRWRAEFNGMDREEIPEIPVPVIREALANSFAHAIYHSNTQHEICIHPNMITIYNPGSFANSHTPEDYVRKDLPSVIRNQLIAKTLYLNKSIEKFGSGFKRIHSFCKDAGINYSYENDEAGFKLIIHRIGDMNVTNPVTNELELTPTERTVYRLICQNPRITRAEIALRISKTERTVQRAFDSLREKEYIERAGTNRTGYWIIK